MPDAVVETKLLLPRLRGLAVDRPRLMELLSRGANTSLTVVSAPAGFGKTTLLGMWIDAGEGTRRTAWVALDERDRVATSFWTYVMLAVDRAAAGSATAALAQLESGRVSVEVVLAGLLNELSVLPDDLTVVLDDYHLADGPGVRPGMTFLVEHLPPQVHLVIGSRADPGLPLARLRARGQLMEVRSADLRFTVEEAAAFLNQVHALGLADADVAALEARTEGWAAALQLAVLSLRGREDPARFIAGFAGADRFVVDYLADEVLDRQPAQVRDFLLDTSVLDRMTGPLCDAVTGGTDGRTTLAALDRQNLFVVPLDDHRRWYRYHHLFADVLQAHLLDERPDQVATLHRRASDWYDRAGDPERAVRHALAAGDVCLAADLVELAIPHLRRHRREAVIRRWVDDLPPDIVANRPVLAVGFIHAFTTSNEFDGVEERLRHVERLMHGPAEGHVVVDHSEYARLAGAIDTYRAALALVAGDLRGTVRHAERALALADAGDLLTVAAASALIGIACWTNGDLEAAHRGYLAAAAGLARAGHTADVLGCTITLADIEVTQGKLGQAHRTLEHALTLAERDDPLLARTRGTADMYVGLSRVAWERGDFAAAADYLDRAEAAGEAAGLPQNPYRWRAAMARLREAAGDAAAAVGLLAEPERLYVGDYAPDVQPVAAARARVLASSGDIAGALAWAHRRGVAVDDELSYQREYEHVTLASILLADHAATGDPASLSQATALLDRLLAAAEAGERTGTVLEVLVLRARAQQADRHHPRALDDVERAVRLAEAEGHVGVFITGGASLVGLMDDLLVRHGRWAFLRRLVQAMKSLDDGDTGGSTESAAGHPGGPYGYPAGGAGRTGQPVLVEPLSDRELDVLRYLCTDLDGPAIARSLSVSLSTVRTHTQHIYAKLGVNNRRAAVRRAHQLNLFSSTSGR
jgi:LuxR family maltose regulon positive regulatory protein